jgi:hypothetical protein
MRQSDTDAEHRGSETGEQHRRGAASASNARRERAERHERAAAGEREAAAEQELRGAGADELTRRGGGRVGRRFGQHRLVERRPDAAATTVRLLLGTAHRDGPCAQRRSIDVRHVWSPVPACARASRLMARLSGCRVAPGVGSSSRPVLKPGP